MELSYKMAKLVQQIQNGKSSHIQTATVSGVETITTNMEIIDGGQNFKANEIQMVIPESFTEPELISMVI